ncbi:redoxin domain-containing protein [Bacteroidales bacterium OttesenSCG-928-C03]|nr:redoxin domain-containing protein [Bacteroidales bacterium OttesenSCG-928-C03]MDL2326775.1 redoxin domain-containing protein [Bacteroidales bacterium OttesenSCG-928-A14]
MNKIIFFALCLVSPFVSLVAQNDAGYAIQFKIEDIPDKTLYIIGCHGSDYYIVDSAKVKKKGVVFKNKTRIIPAGIYQLANNNCDSYLDFIVENDRDFTITTSLKNPYFSARIENSEENTLFFEYMKHKIANDGTLEGFTNDLASFSNNSLLHFYLKTTQYKFDSPAFDEIEDEDERLLQQYLYFKNHFFDNLDLSDSRILRIPVDYGIEYFFTEVVIHNPDSLKKEVDKFIALTKGNKEVRDYLLRELYFIFHVGDPVSDMLFVYLYEQYCPDGQCDWLDELLARRFTRDYKRLYKLMPGKKVPPLEAYDENERKQSTDSIPNKNIILWFWDPDCEDCLDQTPVLYDFYAVYKDTYDIEVYAVSITEDVERWERFTRENQLDWINVSYGMGEPNYDFVDYFDLLTTPAIYLINKDHVILDRMFSLDDLHFIFDK